MKPSAAPDQRPEPIVFAQFRIDPLAGELTRGGTPIPLRPKTWAVLLYLAGRPGVLVTRDELLDAVWPDVAVTPDTLTKSIGELRLALGDDAAAPRFIATVHRRGFRFLAADTGAQAGAAAETPEWHDTTTGARPFVGRSAELAHLERAHARANRGERQVVFVTGPPGVGKTTLIEGLLDLPAYHRANAPVWIARAACVEQHGPREPYMPVLEALGRLARRPDAAALADKLRRTAPTWLAQMPWLLGDGAASLQDSLLGVRPERMLREFAAFAETLTADVMLVLVLEDLHWCDPATVDLLALLGEHREPARLLVIGSYRPAELVVREHVLAKTVRRMLLRRQCSELPLHEFVAEEVLDYLQARFPGADPPPSLVGRLHRHTDGNPLFIASTVEHMLATGSILDTAPGWSFATCEDRIDVGMPDDIRRMIAAQFESLTPADRDVLDVASVCGTEFATHTIAATLRCPVDDVDTRCERLARTQRFIRFGGSSEWPDGSPALRYQFVHELYRQAVYEALSAAARQRLHQRVGEVLEASHAAQGDEHAGALAVHFERGGDAPRTLRYLAAAAGMARHRFAGREAIGYLQSAVAAAQRLSNADERQRQELALRMELAPLMIEHFGFASDPVLANCSRTDELCRTTGTPELRFDVLYVLCHVYSTRADPAFDAVHAELDSLARQIGSEEHRLLSDSATMRTAATHGRFADAAALAEGRLAPFLAAGVSAHPPRFGADPVVDVIGHHAFALWHLGDIERARRIWEGNVVACDGAGVPGFTRAAALAMAALTAMLARDVAAVRQLSGRLLALTSEHAFPFWSAMALALNGWVCVQDDEIDAAIAQLERARAELDATGVRLAVTYICAFRAEAHWRRGDLTAALAAVDDGLRAAESTYDRSYWPELWRLKGELHLAAPKRRRGSRIGAEVEAEQCFLHALQTAQTCQSRSLALRAATSLARAWLARGRAADARDLLEPICQGFAEAVSSPDLLEARALLARLRVDRRREEA